MKKIVLYLCEWVLAVTCFICCGEDDLINKTTIVEVTSVQLTQTDLTLTLGQSVTLTAKVLPENATNKTITWKSSQTSVAIVSSSGTVTAIKEGEATITATVGNKSATCLVKVESNVVEVTDVTLSATELLLMVGDSQTLTATVTPENATDKSVTWTTSNSEVATVSSSGIVKAFKEGEATITATVGNKSATCLVKVKSDMVKVTAVTLSATELSLTVGDSQTLTATVVPDNATDKSVKWESTNSKVATVSSSGTVKAIGAGTATITATAGGKTATCKVDVKSNFVEVTAVTLSTTELSLTVGDSQTLTATVIPENATDKSVTWETSNSLVVTVSSSGTVKAIGVGSATITATAGGKSATCQVKVKQEGGGVDARIDPWGESEEYEGTVN